MRISSSLVSQTGDPLAGSVVQIFGHGLNVHPEGDNLFYVGGFDRPLSCIGLQLASRQLGQLLRSARIHDSVRIEARGLYLARMGRPVLHLVWGEPECVNLSFEFTLSPDQVSHVVRAIREVEPPLSIGLATGQDLSNALKGLQVGGKAQEESVFWLLGRGLGLTPTGDDILSGFGAGLLAKGDWEAFASFSNAVRSVLSERSTTLVSEAYLSAMLSGSANEGMLAFLEAAYLGKGLREPLARARDYGHTSGDDMLLGLYTAFARQGEALAKVGR